jgi:ribosomal protein L16 Arg81 hydroxylase
LAPLPRSPTPTDEVAVLKLALAKYQWLLETQERQRDLVPALAGLERRSGLTSQAFLENHYAVGRPVILLDEMRDWPALTHWTPEYLRTKIGSATVDYQDGRAPKLYLEIERDSHRCRGPFDLFIDAIQQKGPCNRAYITTHNSDHNRATLAPLGEDMGFLDRFLTREPPLSTGMMWIGPAGTLIPLHHDLTNNFIVQLVGRGRLKILPASEVGKIYNSHHVSSAISDLEDPTLDLAQFRRLTDARVYEVVLEPGEILFIPFAWWYQVRSLDFSVTATFTNFLWPNHGYATYPTG